jgi:Zn-finger protein
MIRCVFGGKDKCCVIYGALDGMEWKTGSMASALFPCHVCPFIYLPFYIEEYKNRGSDQGSQALSGSWYSCLSFLLMARASTSDSVSKSLPNLFLTLDITRFGYKLMEIPCRSRYYVSRDLTSLNILSQILICHKIEIVFEVL